MTNEYATTIRIILKERFENIIMDKQKPFLIQLRPQPTLQHFPKCIKKFKSVPQSDTGMPQHTKL